MSRGSVQALGMLLLLLVGCGEPLEEEASPVPSPTPGETPTPTLAPTPVPNKAPTLSIMAPAADTVVEAGTSVSFSILVEDDQDPTDCWVTVESSIDGNLYTGSASTGGLVTFSKVLGPGQHGIAVVAKDGSDLTDTAYFTLRVDVAPEVSISQPKAGMTFALGAPVKVVAEATDEDDPVENLTAAVISDLDGPLATPEVDSLGYIQTTLEELSPGEHVLEVRVMDPVGARGSATVTIRIDSCTGTDGDGDGYGTGPECEEEDCNDEDDTIYPGAEEICNAQDDDCDRKADEGLMSSWYPDQDGDGYGAKDSVAQSACLQPEGTSSLATDCNDADATVHPGAAESCNGKDDNCDGVGDDGDQLTYYLDSDGDGYGISSLTVQGCSQPEGYASVAGDCNDKASSAYPGAKEICDGIDNNCDNNIDTGLTSVYYRDSDGDGYGQTSVTQTACEKPNGYAAESGDCNDALATVNPGQAEVCNGLDDNCDGSIDPNLTSTFYRDADGDGYGSPASTSQYCTQPNGYSSTNSDCDDTQASIHPGATEACNSKDDDCDGKVDEEAPVWYRDLDGDGFGSSASGTASGCSRPTGYVENTSDCDDSNSSVNPAALEQCNGIDDNCTGGKDEGLTQTWYKDKDGDGYGASSSGITSACTMPDGYASSGGDCNDAVATVYPGATEQCNSVDDDCDGSVDESSPIWYRDVDGDGYGALSSGTSSSCSQPAGYVSGAGDCDDSRPAVSPSGVESCNDLDDDCDNSVDEGVTTLYYKDADGDGYGAAASGTQTACSAPGGYVTSSTDCDDSKAAVNPGAAEVCNGADEDCDGVVDDGVVVTWYRDQDQDGYGSSTSTTLACSAPAGYVSGGTDCNDGDASIKPGATETCDGVDQNCDGLVDNPPGSGTYYKDNDNDGYGAKSSGVQAGCSKPNGYSRWKTDCNDASSSVYPGAADSVGDGVDSDCDGRDGWQQATGSLGVSSSTVKINGKAASDGLGYSVASAGDVDGDGFDDVLVCANLADAGGTDTGSIYLFLGPVSGTLETTNADAEFQGENPSDRACNARGVGDVNGDGLGDILFGVPTFDRTSASNAGAAYLVYGPVTGIVRLTNADVRWEGEAGGDYFGYSVAGAGDVNGDGYADLLVGAYSATYSSRAGAGIAYLFLGSQNLAGKQVTANARARFGGGATYDYLGMAVSGAGDVNGDGFDDIQLGAIGASSGYGAAYLIAGSASLSGTYDLSQSSAYKARFTGESYSQAGVSLSAAGDTNGDGYDDLLIGANYYSGSYSGAAYLVLGSTTLSGSSTLSTAGYRLNGEWAYDYAGTSVSGLGDVNDDGFDDLLIGAYGYDGSGSSGSYYGAAYVFFGPILSSRSTSTADLRVLGETNSYLGYSVSSAGDLNADGYGDLILGAYGSDPSSRSDAGVAHAFYGPLLPYRSLSAWQPRYYGEAAGSLVGSSVAGAGDVDRDGLDDVLIGAPGFDGTSSTDCGAVYLLEGADLGEGELSVTKASARLVGAGAGDQAGWSVSRAGDVTGDGVDDFLVGAPGVDSSGADAGAVYVVPGPVTASGTLGSSGAILTGEAAGDQAGYCVAAAGDLDGDGIGDLLVGAWKYDDGSKKDTGAVYVVSGGASLTGTISLSKAKARIVGELNFDFLGTSVAGVGDVNGDGKADILVGAYQNDAAGIDAGAAYLLFGPLNGTISLGTATTPVRLAGLAPGDYAGMAVAGPGDVNGDGYADLLIGSPGADVASKTNNGLAFLVMGSSSLTGKLSLSTAKARVYGEATDDGLGAVLSGGNVNGDVYGDVLLGAKGWSGYALSDNGAAYLITTASSLSGAQSVLSVASRRYQGLATNDLAGYSVAVAGDLDGDGFGELIIGASGVDKASLQDVGAANLINWQR